MGQGKSSPFGRTLDDPVLREPLNEHLPEWEAWRPSGRWPSGGSDDDERDSDPEVPGFTKTPVIRRRDIIQRALAMGGRRAAEEIHSKLHPRYWGVTKKQLLTLAKDLRAAITAGQVRNVTLPNVPPYTNDRFERYGPNMYQVNELFIKQCTNANAEPIPFVSYALQFNSSSGRTCDIFITHVWDEGCFEFIALVTGGWPSEARGAYISVLSNPQHLDLGQLTKAPKDSPFHSVLETQLLCLLMVAGSNVPVHSRLWCVYEAYTAAQNEVQVDFVGDPLHLLAKDHRDQARAGVERLFEATEQLEHALQGSPDEDLEADGEADLEELKDLASKRRASLCRQLDDMRLDVRESACLLERDRVALWGELHDRVKEVNAMIKNHILHRFSYYDHVMGMSPKHGSFDAQSLDPPDGVWRPSFQEHDEVQLKMQTFRNTREAEKKGKLLRVINVSLLILAVGTVCLFIGTSFLCVAGRWGWKPAWNILQWAELLAQACGIAGALVMSTCCQCSTDSVALDELIVRRPAKVMLIVAAIAAKHVVKKLLQKVEGGGGYSTEIWMLMLYSVPATTIFIGALINRRNPGYFPEWARPTHLFVILSLLWSCKYGMDLVWLECGNTDDATDDGGGGFALFSDKEKEWNRCTCATTPPKIVRMLMGGMEIMISIMLFCHFFASFARQGMSRKRSSRSSWAMKTAFWFLYAHLVLVGISWLIGHNITLLLCEDIEHKWMHSIPHLVHSMIYLLPSTVVRLIGGERLLGWLDHKFESERTRMERDGAFIAELLGSVEVELGQIWWVHLEENEKDERFPAGDHRRNFIAGRVVNVSTDTFMVQVWGSVIPRELPLAGRNCVQEELAARARADLRCIEWERLSLELFTGENKMGRMQGSMVNTFQLSRQVAENEVIDFFLSHSWHDSGVDKWVRLERIAASFRAEHGRSPTFWLDRACIRQSNIGDGLAVLPVNVMACNKLLVLAGETYPSRLWCALELVISFAFMPENQALGRVQLEPLGAPHKADEVLKQLSSFCVEDAHCYDPNEEARVRRVVNAVSKQHFESHIRTLARHLTYSSPSRSAEQESVVRENIRLKTQVKDLRRELMVKEAELAAACERELEVKRDLEDLQERYEELLTGSPSCTTRSSSFNGYVGGMQPPAPLSPRLSPQTPISPKGSGGLSPTGGLPRRLSS